MENKRQSNPWWEFVKNHMNEVKHLETRKEKFQMLSELWENEKSKIVTVNVDYLMQLNQSIVELRSHVNVLREENQHLKNVMELLEDR